MIFEGNSVDVVGDVGKYLKPRTKACGAILEKRSHHRATHESHSP